MSPEILHIYGPFAIQWYGVMILTGLLVFLWRASKNPLRKKYLTSEQFTNLTTAAIVVGIIGGRALNIISEWEQYEHFSDIFKIWEGGFSILGTIIAVALFVPWYLRHHKIPIMPVLDLAALYAPLLQAISRIGCLMAGCCHGVITAVDWAITCTNPSMPEFAGELVHPTQLYSAAALLCVFLFLRYFTYPRTTKQGQLFAWYLIGAGLERFGLDFWRAHRILNYHTYISTYQLIALGILLIGITLLIICSFVKTKNYEHI
jgi:phosphatidylglycerol---prolipoprotein diacylglyceryl transferase